MRTENLQQLIRQINRGQNVVNIVGAVAVIGAIAAVVFL